MKIIIEPHDQTRNPNILQTIVQAIGGTGFNDSQIEIAISQSAPKTTRAIRRAERRQRKPVTIGINPFANGSNSGKKHAIKYRDQKGNTWTGGGMPPRWLVDAGIANGKVKSRKDWTRTQWVGFAKARFAA